MQNIVQNLSASICFDFLVDLWGKMWKCYPVLISYFCDGPEGNDMPAVEHGVKMYSWLRWFTSKYDIGEQKVGPTRIANNVNEVSKSYQCHCTVFAKLSEKGKQKETWAKLEELASTLDRFGLNINWGVISLLELSHSEVFNDFFYVCCCASTLSSSSHFEEKEKNAQCATYGDR